MHRSNHSFGKNLLTAAAVSRDDLDDIFDRSDRFLRDEEAESSGRIGGRVQSGRPRVIATMFDQRSTRTRLGFQVAAARLGHHCVDALDTERGRMGSSTGESLSDHVRTLERYVDLMVVRSAHEDMPRRIADMTHLPVINAGNGADEHPSQAIVDLFAIKRMRGDIEGLSVALSSDTHARFALSFVKLLRLAPPRRFTLCTLPDVEINPAMLEAIEVLEQRGSEIGFVHDVRETLGHDVLNISMQDMSNFAHATIGSAAVDNECETEPFRITAEKVLAARSDTLILNPLPRFSEVDVSCDALPNAGYFEQVALSIPVRMAILDRMLAGVPYTALRSIPVAPVTEPIS